MTSVDYGEHSGRLLTSKTDEDVAQIKEVVYKNGHIAIRELADSLGV
jgi:hypothetical protein